MLAQQDREQAYYDRLFQNFRLDEDDWSSLEDLDLGIDIGIGEVDLGGNYMLKVEGYWSHCFSPQLPEEHRRDEAARRAPKLSNRWNESMRHRGYKLVVKRHDRDLGDHGVTYALYKRKLTT